MPSPLKQPIILVPKPEYRIWGGRRLADTLGRDLPEGPYGESWEIHGALQVAEGSWRGRALDSLVEEFGSELLGQRADPKEPSFPLLTKWLDCRDWLSVQVHPDDPLARELTGDPNQRGKSEAWYVAQTEPEAHLIHGLAQGVAPRALLSVDGREMLPLLGYQSPPEGSLLYTGAGTVHSLGPGFLIYEVQQSSDLTYRLYDWERERQIHPAESKRCLLESLMPLAQQDERSLRCPYFEITIREAAETLQVDDQSFTILAAVKGDWDLEANFGRHRLSHGGSVLLPADLGPIALHGQGRVLEIRLGEQVP